MTTKLASILANNIEFHVSYREFLDDLYMSFLFDPVGYSLNDVFLYTPFVAQEFKRENSIIRLLIKSGKFRVHFRPIDSLGIEERIEKSRSQSVPTLFYDILTGLNKDGVGGNIHGSDSKDLALSLDSILGLQQIPMDMFVPWPQASDEGYFDFGNIFSDKIASIIGINFEDSLAKIFEGLEYEKAYNTLTRVLDYISKLEDSQAQFHRGGGFRVTSAVRAMALVNGFDTDEVKSGAALMTKLRRSPYISSDVAELNANAIQIISDLHSETLAESFDIYYANPKTSRVLNLLHAIRSPHNHGKIGPSIHSISIELPTLEFFESLSSSGLQEFYAKFNLGRHAEILTAWRGNPTEANFEALTNSFLGIAEKVRAAYIQPVQATTLELIQDKISAMRGHFFDVAIEATTFPGHLGRKTASAIASTAVKIVGSGLGSGLSGGDPLGGAAKKAVELGIDELARTLRITRQRPVLRNRNFVSITRAAAIS